MTRKTALKRMRRLFPSIARREAYARRSEGRCVVGVEVLSGRGDAGRREPIKSWSGSSWDAAVAKAHKEA